MNSNELIKVIFRTLMDEYGYSFTRDLYSPEFMGNAEVVFASDKTGIRIAVDRGQVFVNIGPLLQPKDEWVDLENVVHFYAPRVKGVYLFQRSNQSYSDIESQVNWVLHVLRKYCKPLLEGNFSDYDRIKEIERKRVREMIETYQRHC